jgi:hypothetical protein
MEFHNFRADEEKGEPSEVERITNTAAALAGAINEQTEEPILVQVLTEIRLLREDLFHYFETFHHTLAGATTGSWTTTTTPASQNIRSAHQIRSSMQANTSQISEEKGEDGYTEGDDKGQLIEQLEQLHEMETREVVRFDSHFVNISSQDITRYICSTRRLMTPIFFPKIAKRREKGMRGKVRESGKTINTQRLDYIHSIHNCVTRHFKLELIRDTFNPLATAYKDPDMAAAVEFIVATYMEVFTAFKYSGLDANVIKSDIKENVRDSLRPKVSTFSLTFLLLTHFSRIRSISWKGTGDRHLPLSL